MARLVPIFVLLVLLVPAQAQAGVASMSSEAFRYNAYAGEVNDVTVTVEGTDSLVVTDATGLVNVEGERCTKLSDRQARCIARPGRELFRFQHQVFLQDENDKGRGPATFRGGDGDDEIVDETGFNWSPELGFGTPHSAGDAGNDTIVGAGQGNEGNDVLRALPGQHSVLSGGVGDDRLEGGSANDFFAPGPGSDHVISGGGRDTLSFDDNSSNTHDPQPAVVFSMENGPQGGRAGESDTYEGTFVEVTVGSSPGSVVTGNALNNRLTGLGHLRGLGGDDELVAGTDRLAGNVETDERLEGGEGDDLLDGGFGSDPDTLDGGNGDDRIAAADEGDVEGDTAGRNVTNVRDDISCGRGKDRIDIDSADPRPRDCEIVAVLFDLRTTITGTSGDDVLPGFVDPDAGDRILGGRGDDIIEALNGPDSLFGQDGNDRLVGEAAGAERPVPGAGSQNDVLSGGTGNDHLIGGYGADRITGGSGADRISGGDANDTIGVRDRRRDKVRCGAGRDTVTADRGDRVSRDCEVVRRR